MKSFCCSSARREAKRLGDDLHSSCAFRSYFSELVHLCALSLNWRWYSAIGEKGKEERWKRSCAETEVLFIIVVILAATAAKLLQSCPTLCNPIDGNPIDGSPPGSPVPGILQARILEWVAIMRIKQESEKAGLKLNIQKTKIMASGPITSWQIDGEKVETVMDLIFLGF